MKRRLQTALTLLAVALCWFGCGRNGANTDNVNLHPTPDKAEQIIKERERNSNAQQK